MGNIGCIGSEGEWIVGGSGGGMGGGGGNGGTMSVADAAVNSGDANNGGVSGGSGPCITAGAGPCATTSGDAGPSILESIGSKDGGDSEPSEPDLLLIRPIACLVNKAFTIAYASGLAPFKSDNSSPFGE
jgi:hypothetical protein